MSRRTKEEAEKTRSRVLASALSLFSSRGYEKTSLDSIAARLKMTKGAVYWHFKSKQDLLTALIDDMLARFRRQVAVLLPDGAESFDGLSFQAVADMMVRNAAIIVSDARATAFFLLVHEQIRWTDASMAKVRSDLLRNRRFGPWEAFRTAVGNDAREGLLRAGVDPVQVASVCVSIWEGLVHARILKVLQCDLEETLSKAYSAVWKSICDKETRKRKNENENA